MTQQHTVVYVPQRGTTDNVVSLLVVLFTLFMWTLPATAIGLFGALAVALSGGIWVIVGIGGAIVALVAAFTPLWLATRL